MTSTVYSDVNVMCICHMLYLSLGRGSPVRGVTVACRERSVHCCRWWEVSEGGHGGRAGPLGLYWTKEKTQRAAGEQQVWHVTCKKTAFCDFKLWFHTLEEHLLCECLCFMCIKATTRVAKTNKTNKCMEVKKKKKKRKKKKAILSEYYP